MPSTVWRSAASLSRANTRSYARIRPRVSGKALEATTTHNTSAITTEPSSTGTKTHDAQAKANKATEPPLTAVKPLQFKPSLLWDHWDLCPPTDTDLRESDAFFQKNESKKDFSAAKLVQVPFTNQPEVAFLGCSNVGKSTLVNALLNKKMANTSHKPGKTTTMNAYNLGDKLTLLDMPGYGPGSKAHWGLEITKYLQQRKELKRVFILLDPYHKSGRGRIKKEDRIMLSEMAMLGVPYQVVITKTDRYLLPTGRKNFPVGDVLKNRVETLHLVMADVKEQMCNLTRGRDLEGRQKIPPFGQLLAVSGENKKWINYFPGDKGAFGIEALRWAILLATGHTKALPSKIMRDKRLKVSQTKHEQVGLTNQVKHLIRGEQTARFR